MAKLTYDKSGRLLYTKEMNRDYTILVPNMAKIHFALISQVLRFEGYNVKVLNNEGPEVIQTGLKYVHNDTCYPALLVIGQMISALESGKYDLDHTALMITQTGGGCRASNYIFLLRKALKKAGMEQVPVISLNLSGLEKNPGFKISISLIRAFVAGLVYGDVIMMASNQTRPYEVNSGDTDKMVNHWVTVLSKMLHDGRGYGGKAMKKLLDDICESFATIKLDGKKRTKVGIVGEIYVKYASLGNNGLEKFLASQGCEVMVPPIISFALFKVDNRIEDINLYGGSAAKKKVCGVLMKYLTGMETMMISSLTKAGFSTLASYADTKKMVDGVIGYGSKMGEGWLLTAEMIELCEKGYPNIVCTQPFGCLPNHIVGKGMIRKITELNPKANIVPIDYDASATRVNQENRIKLMLSNAYVTEDQ